MKNTVRWIQMIALILGATSLIACSAGNMAVNNSAQPPIALVVGEQPQTGQYETPHALVSYSYQLRYTYLVNGTEPSSARTIAMTGQIGSRTRGVDQLRVRVVFLDDKGRSCASHSVFSTGFKERSAGKSFDKQFDVPPRAQSMIFNSNVRMSRGHK